MTLKANEKIKLILERILEEHSLGKENPTSVNVPIYDLTYDSKIEVRNIEPIFEHLEDKGMLILWSLPDNESYDLLCSADFRNKAKAYLRELEEIDTPIKIEEPKTKIQFLEEKGSLYVLVKGKKARLSDDIKSKKAKLVMTLSDPKLGVLRTIESVFDAMRLPTDKYDEYTNKKEVIRSNLKEVNRTLKENKLSLKFKLKTTKGSVAMVVDERKSG